MSQVVYSQQLSRRHLLKVGAALLGGAGFTGLLTACGTSAAPPAPTAAPPTPVPTSPVAPTARPAAAAATPGAPTVAPAAGTSTASKLDLGGYSGPALTNQPVKLRITRQIYSPVADQWWNSLYTQFTAAYPNITFQEEQVPYGDLQTKLQTYVASGDPPDILMGKGDFVPSYVFNEVALDLTPYLSTAFLNDIMPAVRNAQSVGGKLYAWPWEQGNTMFYFNKDLFQQANVQAPPETIDLSQGWTWQQLADAWKQLNAALNKPGAEPSVYALAASEYGPGGPGSSYFYESIYVRSLGDPSAPKDSTAYKTFAGVSPDGLTATGYVDTPEAIKGMQFYQQIFQNGYSPKVAMPSSFDNQTAATKFGGLSFGRRYKDTQKGVSFNWAASPVPKGNFVFNQTTGDSPIILARTKSPAEAAAFMAFVHNDTNRVAWHRLWGNLPARQSLFAMMPEYSQFPDNLGVAMTKAGFGPPATPGYLEYFGAINTAVKEIALGAAVEERLHKVTAEIDGLLAKYKK